MNITVLSLFPWLSTQLFLVQSDEINVFLVCIILFSSNQGKIFCFIVCFFFSVGKHFMWRVLLY